MGKLINIIESFPPGPPNNLKPHSPDVGPPVPQFLPRWPQSVRDAISSFNNWSEQHEGGAEVFGAVIGTIALIEILPIVTSLTK